MTNKLNVTLKTANRRAAGTGEMVIGDGIVDGTEVDVIFWDPPQPEALLPGSQWEVTMDAKTAFWKEHKGKTSFQIRGNANVQMIGEGSGEVRAAQAPAGGGFGRPAAQPQPTRPTQAASKLSVEEVLTKSAEMVKFYADKLADMGAPEDLVLAAAPMAPQIYSAWWFGEKGS